MKRQIKLLSICMLAVLSFGLFGMNAKADKLGSANSNISLQINANGSYSNWDGVSNVCGFRDQEGRYCYAYDGTKNVTVVVTKYKKTIKKVKLAKKHSIFGAVTCDSLGNFYVVTGEKNEGTNTDKKTIYVSKYDKKGNFIKTIGDNGSSSLAYYYGDSFYTKIPFEAGNCDACMYGDILVINYARKMYSGHQSNSMWAINTKTMKKVDLGVYYNSHSFAQRVTVAGKQVILASEGDCYDRAFTISITDKTNKKVTNYNIFDFWVRKGALDDYDMWALNNNYAHMGGIAAADSTHVALVGTSAKSLNANAKDEKERLFIQIFNPTKDLNTKGAYYTTGTRKGLAGPNGDKQVTNYGVKWLTDDTTVVKNPQVVADSKGRFIVLFEKGDAYSFKGTYYMVLSKTGTVLKKATKYSSTAKLNPCRMPVLSGNTIYWTGNKQGDANNNMYVFSLKIE